MSLTKTKTVLSLVTWKHGHYFGGEDTAVTQIDLSEEAFIDMGCPSEITVTVEPGDTLNEEN